MSRKNASSADAEDSQEWLAPSVETLTRDEIAFVDGYRHLSVAQRETILKIVSWLVVENAKVPE